MKHAALSRALVVIFTAVFAHFPAVASACTACMGDVNSKVAPAMNAAIFLMLGCIGFMLASLAGFAFYLMKRANAPLPPHAEFANTINPPEDPS
jgi:hypothetical protein